MREDFFKVIVERPRRNSRDRSARRKYRRSAGGFKDSRSWESAPANDFAGRHRTYGPDYTCAKELNENLTPMLRALRKFCGRPWNDVYSEFREGLDVSSAVHKHVVDHLKQYVNLQVRMADDGSGIPLVPSSRRGHGWEPLFSQGKYEFFYVNPLNGLLCKAPVAIRPVVVAPVLHFRAGNLWLWKRDGFWYSSVLAQDDRAWGNRVLISKGDGERTSDKWDTGPVDRYFLHISDWRDLDSLLRSRVVHVGDQAALGRAKREYPKDIWSGQLYCSTMPKQLNTKELKTFDLQND